jgi:hypothetical protein
MEWYSLGPKGPAMSGGLADPASFVDRVDGGGCIHGYRGASSIRSRKTFSQFQRPFKKKMDFLSHSNSFHAFISIMGAEKIKYSVRKTNQEDGPWPTANVQIARKRFRDFLLRSVTAEFFGKNGFFK